MVSPEEGYHRKFISDAGITENWYTKGYHGNVEQAHKLALFGRESLERAISGVASFYQRQLRICELVVGQICQRRLDLGLNFLTWAPLNMAWRRQHRRELGHEPL